MSRLLSRCRVEFRKKKWRRGFTKESDDFLEGAWIACVRLGATGTVPVTITDHSGFETCVKNMENRKVTGGFAS